MPKKEIKGLTAKQAEKKLQKHGPNLIERKKQLPWLKLLFDQFRSPLVYILFFAGLATFFLQEWTDSVVIFMAVGVNTILGFIQEFKAEKSLIALRKILVPHAQVIRDGQQETIEADKIVPGDLVVLQEGGKVPADGVVIEAVDLFINEAMLTGESVPVEKKSSAISHRSSVILEDSPESSRIYMGTAVVGGRGKMLVAGTGMDTKMGQLAGKLKQTISEQTPLKKQIEKLSRFLAVVFSAVCVVIFIEGLLRQRPWIEMFTLSVAVAVAAIPEGLVISLTVILTLGMQRILKRKGLVRRLLAAETLGSVNIICADKTGTLTEGKMKVVKADISGDNQKLILKAAVLCNNMTNPLEIAMMEWAKRKLKIKSVEGMINSNPRVAEIPFSSKRKFIATLNKTSENKAEMFLSGAPEMVMEMACLKNSQIKKWQEKLDQLTKKGLRVVAFASHQGNLKTIKKKFQHFKKDFQDYNKKTDCKWEDLNLEWVGLLGFEDPPRMAVKKSLAVCKKAGIEVKVITGDYRNTAAAVLEKLDLAEGGLKENQILEGWQLERMGRKELKKSIDDVVLFARTTPEQKIRIVEILQEKGNSVAMMGDGVNDALALKKADIGVVVGEATEVAKGTADMVLLDSNFKTVIAAVEEGRAIFENIRKVVLYLLSDSFTEILLISVSLFLGLPAPILAPQILWVNLVEDGLPGLALAFEPKDNGLMEESPRKKNTAIINKELKILIFVIGLVTDFLLLAIFLALLKIDLDLRMIRTIIFAALGMDSLLYVFSCKTLRKNLWHEDIFSNKHLNFAVLIGFFLLILGIYLPFSNKILKTVPLGFWPWLLIFGKGTVNILGIETVKWLFLRKGKNGS